jgi:hypothetical protein
MGLQSRSVTASLLIRSNYQFMRKDKAGALVALNSSASHIHALTKIQKVYEFYKFLQNQAFGQEVRLLACS